MTEHVLSPVAEAAHAFLSASGSERWINCPPSARFEERFPDSESEYAREGSLGHDIVKLMVLYHLGRIDVTTFTSQVHSLKTSALYTKADGSGHLYSTDLQSAINDCYEFAVEAIAEARAADPGAIFLVEQKLDFSTWVPHGWGTGDLVILAARKLRVIDWKFGRGKNVEAEGNSQCRLYGLGAFNMYNMLYAFDELDVVIFQPRLGGHKHECSKPAELLAWANVTVVPKAQLAWKGEGDFAAGDWCMFCRAKHECKTRAEYLLSLEQHITRHPNQMTPQEVALLLPRAHAVTAWAEQLEEYALSQATSPARVRFPGWKLVAGRANRYITNSLLAREALVAAGYDETVILKDPELKGITELKAVVGSDKKLAALLVYKGPDGSQVSLLHKPTGKPVLVADSDSRPEMQLDSAVSDFAHLIKENQ